MTVKSITHEISRFETALSEQGLSAKTEAAYLADVKAFFNASEDRELSEQTVRDYLNTMKESGATDATACRALSSLRRFFGFLQKSGVTDEDPTRNIRLGVPKRRVGDVLTVEQTDRYLMSPNINTVKGLRDSAILELLYATGMTVSELIALNVEDWDERFKTVSVVGRKQSKMQLYPSAYNKLSRYLSTARDLMAQTSETALFVSRTGERLTRQGIWKIFREYATACDFPFAVTPETLRRSLVYHLLQGGISDRELMRFLRHENLSATKALISLLSDKTENGVFSFHPHAR